MSRRIDENGFGECCNRGEYPPRRSPWFLDNGAYGDWQSGRAFDDVVFWFSLILALASVVQPDFVVCPDRVATGLESLAFSLRWLDEYASRLLALRSWVRLAEPRWYLAVQDGMTVDDVRPVMHRFAGIFVGGTYEWKRSTGATWVGLAHELSKPCHIGRCGTEDLACWALRIGADSIDSALPLWADANFNRFMRGLRRGREQQEMPWGPTRDE